MKLRAPLYWLARLLGDANAVSKGPGAIGRRLVRKAAWRGAARVLGKLPK